MTEAPTQITQLLRAWNQGDLASRDRLITLLYKTLRQLAEGYLRQERANHTLQATALVNEAFLRLANGSKIEWQNRAHFFGVAARIMRQILVEYARSHNRLKRGSGITLLTLDEAIETATENNLDLLALDDALTSLATFATRQAQIIEMRFFGGLSIEEVAAVLHIAPITVKREWKEARIWLYRELSREEKK